MHEISVIFAFLTYISTENHSMKWIKENKTQNKILIFPGFGGQDDFSQNLGVWGEGVEGLYVSLNLIQS